MPANTRIQLRRDTSNNWTSVNPVLLKGEIGYETDTNYIKIGDGTTAWRSLAYATVLPSDSRLTNARFPTAHASTHGVSGSDPITISSSQVTGLDTALSGTAGSGHTHDLAGATITGTLPESKGGTGATTGAGLVPIIPTTLGYADSGDNTWTFQPTPTTNKASTAGILDSFVYFYVGGIFSSNYTHYRLIIESPYSGFGPFSFALTSGTSTGYWDTVGTPQNRIDNASVITTATSGPAYTSRTITGAVSNGTTITYTGTNTFSAGQTVSITGFSPSGFNSATALIATASGSQFTVTSSLAAQTATGTGTAVRVAVSLTATRDGTTVTYTGNNEFQAGQTVTITGFSSSTFNLSNVKVVTASSSQFTVASSLSAATATGTGKAVFVATVTYTGNNFFQAGKTVTITGLTPTALNLSSVTIASATSTEFTVTNTAVGTTVPTATVTAAAVSGSTITYTANNSFTNGQAVTVRGLSNVEANVSGTVSGATSTSFTFTGQSAATQTVTGQSGIAGANGTASIPAAYTASYTGYSGTADGSRWTPNGSSSMSFRNVFDIAHPFDSEETTYSGTSGGSAAVFGGIYAYTTQAEGLVFINATNAYFDVTVWVYGYNNV